MVTDNGLGWALGAVGALAAMSLGRGTRGSRDHAVAQQIDRASPQAVAKYRVTLLDLLAVLRAAHWEIWTLHWQVSGTAFYGDHLLFERLYTGKLLEQIDGLGERIVALFNSRAVDSAETMARADKQIARWKRVSDPVQRALLVETSVADALREAYRIGKADDLLTQGMDDFLLAAANDHDTNRYLLLQRSRGGSAARE